MGVDRSGSMTETSRRVFSSRLQTSTQMYIELAETKHPASREERVGIPTCVDNDSDGTMDFVMRKASDNQAGHCQLD